MRRVWTQRRAARLWRLRLFLLRIRRVCSKWSTGGERVSMRVLVIEPAGQLWGSERALLDMIESVVDVEFTLCCPPDCPLLQELIKRRIRALPYFTAELHRKPRWRRLVATFGVLRAILA